MASDFDKFLLSGPQAPQASGAPATASQTPADDQEGGASSYVPPVLQATGAGLVQGVRDVGQTLTGWTGAFPTWHQHMVENTAAYRQKYGSSIPASLAEGAAGMLTTVPATAAAAAMLPEAAISSIPVVGAYALPALEGAIAGGGSNLLMSGGTGENPLSAGLTGALGGGVIGGALSKLGAMTAGSQAVQDAAQRLGIRLSLGQRAGGLLKNIEDVTQPLPLSGAGEFASQQNADVTRVLANNAMAPGVSSIDTPGLEAMRQAVGQRIGNIMGQFDVPYDAGLHNDVTNILRESLEGGPGTEYAHRTQNLVDQLQNLATGNAGRAGPGISGQQFQQFIAHGSALDRALNFTGTDYQQVRSLAGDLRQAMIDAAERSPNTAPGAVDALREARYAYKVIKTIEPVIQRTPEGSETMSLPRLGTAIYNNFIKGQTSLPQPGQMGHDMLDLYQLINGPTAPIRSSGTAERSLVQRMLGLGAPGAGLSGGALAALGYPGAAETALTGGAIAGGGGLLGRAMRFGPGMGGKGPVWGPWARYQQLTNPLMPRAMGPMVGNMLTGNQPQEAPQ